MKKILTIIIGLFLIFSQISISVSGENISEINIINTCDNIITIDNSTINPIDCGQEGEEEPVEDLEEDIDVIIIYKYEIDDEKLKDYKVLKHNFKSFYGSSVKIKKINLKNIEEDPDIESVEIDQDIELFGQTTPWGIDKVNAPNIWNDITGKNVKIAVVDSGVSNHEDLDVKGGISFIENTNYNEDILGHGTTVAGVISAQNNDKGIVGVAPDSEIYSVKVIDSTGKLSDLLKGIEWSIENNIDIVVLSLGVTEDSPALRKVVDEAYLSDILVVSASGRDGQLYYPAKYSSVIAVGSIDENNELGNENGAGEELEFVAPGENILSTDNQNGYVSFSGTSMAAPHVAGVAALLKENDNSLSVNEIRAKLQRDAVDLGDSGKDNSFGYGLVNVNIEEENLGAVIQIVFPEETDEIKKQELEINPIKVEIIRIENENKNVVQTLFYDGNQGIQNISVEVGQYEVKQYLDNEIYSNEYNISDGDLIVVPLYLEISAEREFVVDAPYRVEPGQYVPIFFEIRDAYGSSYWEYSFYAVEIYDANNGDSLVRRFTCTELGLPIDSGTYCTVNIPRWYTTKYLNPNLFVKDANNKIKIKAMYDGWGFPDGDAEPDNEPYPLVVHIDNQNYPKFSNWYCGDTHYHSEYTDTKWPLSIAGEFGGPIDATVVMLDVLGLDWVTVTDHSNSFTNHKTDELSWNNFKQNCNNYNKCLIGTEINCDYSSTQTGNHLLAYDYPTFIDDYFTSNNFPTDNNPSCSAVISNVNSQGGFTYPAHPEAEKDWGGIIGIMETWHDYSLPFVGLQVWNEDITDPVRSSELIQNLENGLSEWKNLILNGRKVFISAGSDAHGDFQNFAKEVTCVYAPSYSKSNIFYGLEHGNSYMGNNGALKFEIETPSGNAKLGEEITIVEGDEILINTNYKLINSCNLKLFRGKVGVGASDECTVVLDVPISSEGTYSIDPSFFHSLDPNCIVTNDYYYRMECKSNNRLKRIYTNPIWVKVLSDTDGDGIADINDNCPNIPNLDQLNTDGDSQGDVCDTDDDNDGLSDTDEALLGTDPLNPDTEGDGVNDNTDNCPLTSNPTQDDNDGDLMGDICDPDDDNDFIVDIDDNCPLDTNQDQANNDGDSQGDVCDTDDDNDTVLDVDDAFPFDPTESVDTDNDGIGNNADEDDDNDVVLDVNDLCPLEAGNPIDGCPLEEINQGGTEPDEGAWISANGNLAQPFIPTKTPITKVSVWLANGQIGNDRGVVVSIRNDINGADLVSATQTVCTGCTEEYDIPLQLDVTPGNTYYLVLTYVPGSSGEPAQLLTGASTVDTGLQCSDPAVWHLFDGTDICPGRVGDTYRALAYKVYTKVNYPPMINDYTVTDLNPMINEGDTIDFTLTVIDVNDDPLTYSWKLDGVEQSTEQNWSYTTDYLSAGSHIVNVNVSDGSLQDSKEWNVVVTNTNREPVLELIEDITVQEGEEVQINPSVTDPDNDIIMISFTSPLDSETGRWQTDFDDEGNYIITVTVDDSNGGIVSQDVTITVNNVVQTGGIVCNEVYDDFSGENLDLTKWEEYDASKPVDEHNLDITNQNYHTEQLTPADRGIELKMLQQLQSGDIIEFDVDYNSGSGNHMGCVFWDEQADWSLVDYITCLGKWDVIEAYNGNYGTYHYQATYNDNSVDIIRTLPDGTDESWRGFEGAITPPYGFSIHSRTGGDGISHFDFDNFKLCEVNYEPEILTYSPLTNPITINEEETISFTHTSTDQNINDELTYSWKLDGVEKSTEQDWTYTTDLSSAGNYVVTLGVSDGNMETTKSWDVVVNDMGSPQSPPGSPGGGGGSGGGGTPTGCQENWACNEWRPCSITETQKRICSDIKNCGTDNDKPEEKRACVYKPTCDDEVQNGDETGVDCGGSCEMTCEDKEQEKEKGLDIITGGVVIDTIKGVGSGFVAIFKDIINFFRWLF